MGWDIAPTQSTELGCGENPVHSTSLRLPYAFTLQGESGEPKVCSVVIKLRGDVHDTTLEHDMLGWLKDATKDLPIQ